MAAERVKKGFVRSGADTVGIWNARGSADADGTAKRKAPEADSGTARSSGMRPSTDINGVGRLRGGGDPGGVANAVTHGFISRTVYCSIWRP